MLHWCHRQIAKCLWSNILEIFTLYQFDISTNIVYCSSIFVPEQIVVRNNCILPSILCLLHAVCSIYFSCLNFIIWNLLTLFLKPCQWACSQTWSALRHYSVRQIPMLVHPIKGGTLPSWPSIVLEPLCHTSLSTKPTKRNQKPNLLHLSSWLIWIHNKPFPLVKLVSPGLSQI